MLVIRNALSLILAVAVIPICLDDIPSRQHTDQATERKKNNFVAFEVMRLITTLEESYRAIVQKDSFGNSEQLFKLDLIGPGLASALGVRTMKSDSGQACEGERRPFHGYLFRLEAPRSNPDGRPEFTAVGFPAIAAGASRTGDYSFFVDEGNRIRVSTDPKVLASAMSLLVGDPEAPDFEEITNGIQVSIGDGSIPGQLFPDGTVCTVDARDPSQCTEVLFKVPDNIMKRMNREYAASCFYGIFDLDNDAVPEVLLGYWLPDDPGCSPTMEEGCVNLLVYKRVRNAYRLYAELQAQTMGYNAYAWFLNESPPKAIILTRYQGSSGDGIFYLDLKKRSLRLMTDDLAVSYAFFEDINNDGAKEVFVLGRVLSCDLLGGGLLRWKGGAYHLYRLQWPRWASTSRLMYADLIKLDDKQKGIVALLKSAKGNGNVYSTILELAVFRITKRVLAMVDKAELPAGASSSEPEILSTSQGEQIHIRYRAYEDRMETLKCLFRNGKITCDKSRKAED
ncbi:MAG TPA: hypothetical protein VLM38_19830 [Blastocatellia bacterium]|nr:hypothetical protein [Blastocatellia bacterium]